LYCTKTKFFLKKKTIPTIVIVVNTKFKHLRKKI
jgi:hypothetical protein